MKLLFDENISTEQLASLLIDKHILIEEFINNEDIGCLELYH